MPNSDNIYLPVYFTKHYLHEKVQDELYDELSIPLSYKMFIKFWKKYFPKIKIPKNFKMGQCDACLEIQRLKLNKASNIILQQKQLEHNKLHSSARQFCSSFRITAQAQPFKLMYIQYDGKQASRIPHIVPLTKDTQNLPKVKLNVYGLSNFAFNNQTSYYIFLPHWETGSNISITILYDYIKKYFVSINYKRPAELMIQVDNCAKEGKNRTVFAFAAHLVKFGWFSEVHIISLIQGHTHDLIDQDFSIWTKGERKYGIESLYQLSKFMRLTFKDSKKTTFTVLRSVYDWSEYFESTLTTFKQFQDARLFKICKENTSVVMYFKTNCLETK
jgi:hypothetical protein